MLGIVVLRNERKFIGSELVFDAVESSVKNGSLQAPMHRLQ
jgi:hypothetical protein